VYGSRFCIASSKRFSSVAISSGELSELAANDLVFGSADHLRKRFVHVCVRAVRPRLSNAGMDPVEDEGEVPLALIENGTARTKLLLSLKIHSSQILQLTPELTNL
jgi:hypothetical protein